MQRRKSWVRDTRGQSATEYILILSVIVLGILAGASALIPTIGAGVSSLAESLTTRFENNPLTECGPGERCGG
jgi:Flp pilus assembly pilin Flp